MATESLKDPKQTHCRTLDNFGGADGDSLLLYSDKRTSAIEEKFGQMSPQPKKSILRKKATYELENQRSSAKGKQVKINIDENGNGVLKTEVASGWNSLSNSGRRLEACITSTVEDKSLHSEISHQKSIDKPAFRTHLILPDKPTMEKPLPVS